MAQDVVMPQMGESIAGFDATKSVGDTVERDEALFEMSTDKVDAEIHLQLGNPLEIKVEAGATVGGTVVAVIGAAGEMWLHRRCRSATRCAEEAAAPAAAPVAAANDAPQSAEERRRVKSSPVVRKIAQHNVDITLSGTAPVAA